MEIIKWQALTLESLQNGLFGRRPVFARTIKGFRVLWKKM
jgi:hypothetical protein